MPVFEGKGRKWGSGIGTEGLRGGSYVPRVRQGYEPI